jgi:arylformamidase
MGPRRPDPMNSIAVDTQPWQRMLPAERERAYSPSSCIGGDYLPHITAYQTRSAQARAHSAALGATWATHRYGDQSAQLLQLCMPQLQTRQEKAKPGLLVFIHGGYWQELSATDSLFPAAACIARGQAFAAIDYTLAPAASVAEIVAECRQALVWLFRHAPELGLDASRIIVAGSSAGAHLAAMVAVPGALPDNQGDAFAVRAVVLVSGIYELEPLIGTSINTALALNPASARQVSPALLPFSGFPETVVCWGAVETDEFKRQSRDFAASLRAAGAGCESFEIAQRNHFDVILDIADASTCLGAATFSLFHAS